MDEVENGLGLRRFLVKKAYHVFFRFCTQGDDLRQSLNGVWGFLFMEKYDIYKSDHRLPDSYKNSETVISCTQ